MVILVAGVLGCGVAAFVLREVWRDWRSPARVENVARVPAMAEHGKQQGKLGHFRQMDGTRVLRAPLELREEISLVGSYGSKGVSSIQNFFFLNPNTRKGHWLRKPFGGIILDVKDVSEPVGSDEKGWQVVASVYEIIPEDSNRDGRLTAADIWQIGVSAPDGAGFRILVERADRMEQVVLLESRRVLVLYTLDAKLSAVEFDPHAPDTPPTRYEIATEFVD